MRESAVLPDDAVYRSETKTGALAQFLGASMTCVAPQATMNIPKQTKIQLKGRSRRLRMNQTSVSGIAKYASAISRSEIACSQTSPAFQR
jgi:hypothetical protein